MAICIRIMATVFEYPVGLRAILRHHSMMMMMNESQSRQLWTMASFHQDSGICARLFRGIASHSSPSLHDGDDEWIAIIKAIAKGNLPSG